MGTAGDAIAADLINLNLNVRGHNSLFDDNGTTGGGYAACGWNLPSSDVTFKHESSCGRIDL